MSVWSDETGRRNKSSKQDPRVALCCSLVFIKKKKIKDYNIFERSSLKTARILKLWVI